MLKRLNLRIKYQYRLLNEPADIEAEEVKPRNKVPVQTTDDTVETDAEEIKPQNKEYLGTRLLMSLLILKLRK